MQSETRRLEAAIRIVQHQAGDDMAIEWLVEEYHPRVRKSVASRLGNDRSAVDDVTQQIWLEVLRQLNTLREPMAWEAWLSRITQSHVVKYRRARTRQDAPLDEVVLAFEEDNDKWIEDENLRSAVDCLAPHHRDMLVLRFWHSLSY